MEPLTNLEADVLAEKVEDQGGWVDDEQRCKACNNFTIAIVAYRPKHAKKDRYGLVCMWCDNLKAWPRMENR